MPKSKSKSCIGVTTISLPLPIDLQKTNGHQSYENWDKDKMITYHPKAVVL